MARGKTPATTPAYSYYRDTLDDTLYRRAPNGVPELLTPSGKWKTYIDADLTAGAMPITEAGAKALAGGASLTAATAAATPRRASRTTARTS